MLPDELRERKKEAPAKGLASGHPEQRGGGGGGSLVRGEEKMAAPSRKKAL